MKLIFYFLQIQISRPTSPSDERTSPAVGSTQTGYLPYNGGQTQLQMPQTTSAVQSQQIDRPYKPKFHKAALYHHSSNGSADPTTASASKETLASNAHYTNRGSVSVANVSTASTTTLTMATATTVTTISSSNLSHQPMVDNNFLIEKF